MLGSEHKLYCKAFLINDRNPMDKKVSKSDELFLSYQHSANLGKMAGAAWLVNQKGLVRFQKFLFHVVSNYYKKC